MLRSPGPHASPHDLGALIGMRDGDGPARCPDMVARDSWTVGVAASAKAGMREEKPGMREGKLGVREGKPGMREGKLGVREEKPGMREGPGVREGKPGMREASSSGDRRFIDHDRGYAEG